MIVVDVKGEIDINENLKLTSAQVREGQIREITQYAMELKTRSAQKLNAKIEPGGFNELQDGLYYEWANAGDNRVYIVVGDRASFAGTYEFGLKATESVRAYARRIREAFGKPLKGEIEAEISPHTREMNKPPHPFIYASLKEMDLLKGRLSKMLDSVLPEAL